jgi:hypothetical protein
MIMPGIVGPRRLTADDFVIGHSMRVRLELEFDDERRRYVCRELVARDRDVTGELLRHVPVSRLVYVALRWGDQPAVRAAENPDGHEPWGLHAPDGIAGGGPTERALQWTAHAYGYADAVGLSTTETVQSMLGLSRATTGRWIAKARAAGYLEPTGAANWTRTKARRRALPGALARS